ncbi:MAG: toll/interleukin-1 receptor domain-containing protein [Acidobacteriota bacterium]|nr:toll/interleukin-1 receptor domain-containing protein [Acidobacteriota bacterium]
MAYPKHVRILKRGVAEWNRWRDENRDIKPDLHAVFKHPFLPPSISDWEGFHLDEIDFDDSDYYEPDLRDVELNGANLRDADLRDLDLRDKDISGADLGGTDLRGADLRGADLKDARLIGAHLNGANLTAARLANADLFEASLFDTTLADIDLSEVKNLESVIHLGPSNLGINTIYKSRGNIPEKFLRGCGVPEDFITYLPSLTRKAIEFYSCFISYSSKDEEFARRLYADLQSEGVRCWFAPEDLKIGEKFRIKIDESIRLYDKLLLVLSESSVESEWVEKEVETAFEKEGEQKKTVLFPVRLDDAVLEAKTGWAADIRRTRHIGDFREWKNHDSYRKAFERLMRDLKAEASR